MAPFDRSHRSSYPSSIVTIAVSCTVFEIKLDIGRKCHFSHALVFNLHNPLEPLQCAVVTDLEGARGAIALGLLLLVQASHQTIFFNVKLSRTAHLVTKSVSLRRSEESRHSCRVGPPPGCLIF